MSQFLFLYRGGIRGDASPAEREQPYAEKDLVCGFSIIEAKDISHATELSLGCPIFLGGAAVEVRPIASM